MLPSRLCSEPLWCNFSVWSIKKTCTQLQKTGALLSPNETRKKDGCTTLKDDQGPF